MFFGVFIFLKPVDSQNILTNKSTEPLCQIFKHNKNIRNIKNGGRSSISTGFILKDLSRASFKQCEQ
jgi:hypothetical protein